MDSTVNHPALHGLASLMRRACAGEDLVPLGQSFLKRAQDDQDDANAWMDFSTVLLLTGNPADALAVQAEAIGIEPLYALPARHGEPGLRLLALKGPGDLMANTPVECLVDDSDVSLQMLYLTTEGDWPDSVPDHDVMFVAVGQSEANAPLLQRLIPYVRDWPRPVINRPEGIATLTRHDVSARLQGAPGIDMPVSADIGRAELLALSDGNVALNTILSDGGFPLIVRPLDSHAGTLLEKLEGPAAIPAYLGQTTAERFYISRFVDYGDADGLYRKYRIVLIDGKPYIAHFAVSGHWIVHYMNAGMARSAEKRAEEALRMQSFDDDFAVRHAAAMAAIHARIGMPYLVIDCAEGRDGRLLVFEVDNSAVVHDLDPEDIYPYKKPVMKKLFAAFRRMLEDARENAKQGPAGESSR